MVILTARNEDALQEVCSEHPGRCHAIAADLATAEGRRHLVTSLGQILKTESGHLSGLVNNAGFLKAVPFLELTEEDWNAHYRVNLLAPALLVKELAPLFGPDGGHIVNISSMGGFQGSRKFPGLSAYSAMKGALAILTESMAAELNGKNLCVNALCLGAVQTEMLEEAFPGFQAPVQPDRMGRWIAEFLVHGHRLFNGKILPVSLTDPQ